MKRTQIGLIYTGLAAILGSACTPLLRTPVPQRSSCEEIIASRSSSATLESITGETFATNYKVSSDSVYDQLFNIALEKGDAKLFGHMEADTADIKQVYSRVWAPLQTPEYQCADLFAITSLNQGKVFGKQLLLLVVGNDGKAQRYFGSLCEERESMYTSMDTFRTADWRLVLESTESHCYQDGILLVNSRDYTSPTFDKGYLSTVANALGATLTTHKIVGGVVQ